MNIGLLAQYAVVAVLVAMSTFYTVRKLAPVWVSRRQAAVAALLLKPGRGAFAQRLGRALQPRGATGDCGDGCGTCGSCGPTDATDATDAPDTARNAAGEQPLVFHPPRR